MPIKSVRTERLRGVLAGVGYRPTILIRIGYVEVNCVCKHTRLTIYSIVRLINLLRYLLPPSALECMGIARMVPRPDGDRYQCSTDSLYERHNGHQCVGELSPKS
jgi:hypothetical protein